MIDFHTHILPAIDDGSKTKEQSLAMLKKLQAQGITTVLATPHFYPDQEIEAFLKSRQAAYEALVSWGTAECGRELPKIVLGAEVLVGAELTSLVDLNQLCIEGTRYMLLEMPYGVWGKWVYQVVDELIEQGMTPIIAHLERYESIAGLEAISQLMTRDVLGQMNVHSMANKNTGKLCEKLLNKQMIHVLGSDVHRVRQLDQVAKGYECLRNKCTEERIAQLHQNGKAILADQKIDRTSPKTLKKILGFYI